ncbi:kelch-like protein 40 [Drosophila subobscura]|uniref:kelch-like protein 40 n=1 Tax=Drosophila subobscura TaxID=7241 RepID=UPI00155AB8AA|nr:kelch-like protein 40 [Drosophila subobscura]
METWLANAFKGLIVEEDFTDCCVIVESNRFKCHKVILGLASEFFKRGFQSDFAEAASGELWLSDTTAKTFEKFRLFAYTYDKEEVTTYDNETIIKLLDFSSIYLVAALSTVCMDIIKKRIPKMNYPDVLKVFEFAHHITNDDLIKLTSKYINCFREPVPSEVYQLGSDVFREFIKLLSDKESIRFEIIEKYVAMYGFVSLCCVRQFKWQFKGLYSQSNENTDAYANENPFKIETSDNATDKGAHAADSKRNKLNNEYVKDLLTYVKYEAMSVHEFYKGPGKSKLLTLESKYELLYKIAANPNVRIQNGIFSNLKS